MAIDNTPPRLKLIVTIAVITVITLIGIDFATKSYFAFMSDEAKHEKIAPTRDKDEQRKAEAAAFAQAAIPLDQAMANFGQGQRPDAITPTQSDDVAPVTGWNKLPHPAPTLQHPVADVNNVPTLIGDGGVMLYADGGAMLGPDGGAMIAPMSAADGGTMASAMDGGASSNGGGAGDAGARHHGNHNDVHAPAPGAPAPGGNH